MDKIITNENIFDDLSPFTVFSVENFVFRHTNKTYFFKEWIRHSENPLDSIITLTANDGTGDFVQVKICKNDFGYYLVMSNLCL